MNSRASVIIAIDEDPSQVDLIQTISSASLIRLVARLRRALINSATAEAAGGQTVG